MLSEEAQDRMSEYFENVVAQPLGELVSALAKFLDELGGISQDDLSEGVLHPHADPMTPLEERMSVQSLLLALQVIGTRLQAKWIHIMEDSKSLIEQMEEYGDSPPSPEDPPEPTWKGLFH